MNLDALRARFATPRPFHWEPEWPADDAHNRAAILIPIQPDDKGPRILLTRRTDHLHHHPGQISFPGGRVEADDDTPVHTALRESEEEIGLPVTQVELLGQLPEYTTSSGFRVTPVVGIVPATFEVRLDTFEVAELFGVPLDFVLDPVNLQRHRVQRGTLVRHFHALPYPGRFIWGVTAGILAMFAAFTATDAPPKA